MPNWQSKFLFRFISTLLIADVSRLLFLLLNYPSFHHNSFNHLASLFLYGLRFDISSACLLFSVWIMVSQFPLFKPGKINETISKWLFMVPASISIILNCIDLEYFKFTKKRTGAELFTVKGMGQDIVQLMPRFIADYWYLFLFAAGLIYLQYLLYRIPSPKPHIRTKVNWKDWAFYLLILLGAMLGFRGGFQLRPIKPITAGLYTSPDNFPLVLNTPFNLIKTITADQIEPVQFYTENEAERIFSTNYQPQLPGVSEKPNVVIIILESFSQEYIGYFNPKMNYTPFLDSLLGHGRNFIYTIANGKRSIDGIPSILGGMPTLMNTPYISSPYATNKTNSLAWVLKKQGYSTSFYHGGHNGTMGFDYYCKLSSFDEYIGLNEYRGNAVDLDGNWGVYDGPFLQFFCNELCKKKQPFFSSVFTLSSHHPFTMPKDYKYPGTANPVHPILKTIRYTDDCLRAFFKAASKQPWFKNTLFVITADHCGTPLQYKYQTMYGNNLIPLLYYMPGKIPAVVDKRTTQQIDILPTVAHYTGVPFSFFKFGSDMADTTQHPGALNFFLETQQLIKDSLLLHYYDEKFIRLLVPQRDTLLQLNYITDSSYNKVRIEMEKELKARIQLYFNSLSSNKTSIE